MGAFCCICIQRNLKSVLNLGLSFDDTRVLGCFPVCCAPDSGAHRFIVDSVWGFVCVGETRLAPDSLGHCYSVLVGHSVQQWMILTGDRRTDASPDIIISRGMSKPSLATGLL